MAEDASREGTSLAAGRRGAAGRGDDADSLIDSQLFELTFRHATIGMALVGLDGRWLRVNDAMCRMVGYRRDELLELDAQRLTHPDDLDLDVIEIDRLLAGETLAIEYEKRFLHRDSHVVWVRMTASLARDGNGEPRLFIAQLEDLTASKAAATALEQYFQRSRDLIAIASADGHLRRVNPAWTRALGWSADELVLRPFLDLVHPDDRAATVAEAQAVYTGQPSTEFRNRYRAKDGSYRWLEWKNHIMPDGTLYCAVRDVSVQHEMARALAESEARFRALAEGSIQGIVVERIEENHRPLFINPAAATMFGFASVTEAMALPSLAVLVPAAALATSEEHWPRLAAAVKPNAGAPAEGRADRAGTGADRAITGGGDRAITGGGDGDRAIIGAAPSIQGRVEMRRRDGQPIWVEVMGSAIAWDDRPAFQMTLHDVTARVELERDLERLAATDPLTGLHNRHRLGELARLELLRVDRHPQPMSVMVIDADQFKAINDRHGHPAGDEVLRALAGAIRGAVRETDEVGRWGGEELVIVLIATSLAEAGVVAERILTTCRELVVRHGDATIGVTVSIGVTERRDGERSFDDILARADRAMYRAKAEGRDRVVVVT